MYRCVNVMIKLGLLIFDSYLETIPKRNIIYVQEQRFSVVEGFRYSPCFHKFWKKLPRPRTKSNESKFDRKLENFKI